MDVLPATPPQVYGAGRRASSVSDLALSSFPSLLLQMNGGGAEPSGPAPRLRRGSRDFTGGGSAENVLGSRLKLPANRAPSPSYDSLSGSEVGTPIPSDLDPPTKEPLRALFPPVTASGGGSSSSGSSTNLASGATGSSTSSADMPFTSAGSFASRDAQPQAGIVSSEPDIHLLDALFDVLQPARGHGADTAVSPGSSAHSSPLVTQRSLNAERQQRVYADALAKAQEPALPQLSGRPALPALHVPVHDVAANLQGMTVTPRSAAMLSADAPLGLADPNACLKYFGGGQTPGLLSGTMNLFSPTMPQPPSAQVGGSFSLPLFSPTGTTGMFPPLSPSYQ